MYLVTQFYFLGGELFQVLQKKCFNGKVGKLCLLWYKKYAKNSPLLRNQKMEEKSKRW
jgi:hypothetical protein